MIRLGLTRSRRGRPQQFEEVDASLDPVLPNREVIVANLRAYPFDACVARRCRPTVTHAAVSSPARNTRALRRGNALPSVKSRTTAVETSIADGSAVPPARPVTWPGYTRQTNGAAPAEMASIPGGSGATTGAVGVTSARAGTEWHRSQTVREGNSNP